MKNKLKRTLAAFTAFLMLICILPAGIFAEGGGIPIDAEHFPDENFRNFVLEGYYSSLNDDYILIDENEDGFLSQNEIAKTTFLEPQCSAANLKGIEYFTSLTYLDCSCNQLTELNINGLTKLWYLDCSDNQLTELNINGLTKLTYLDCSCNQLTELDVDANIKLDYFHCGYNRLTELDISHNAVLTNLCYSGNPLTNPNQPLETLPAEAMPGLKYLDCSTLNLTELNVQPFTALEKLWCCDNKLTALDVSNNAALGYLECECNQLTQLDVSSNTALTELSCGDNLLTALDLSGNTALTELSCGGNRLAELNVTRNTMLTVLGCGGNQLTELDLSGSAALSILYCDVNKLTNLNLNGVNALETLSCSDNQLTGLNVSGNPALTELYCDNNRLTQLDVSGNPALAWLECRNNQLTSLIVNGAYAMKKIVCSSNQLTELDVSSLTALWGLYCGDNRLTELVLNGDDALRVLWCFNNQLTKLDLSGNSNLVTLRCSNNHLTSLDLSQNTNLSRDYLECNNNVYYVLQEHLNEAGKLQLPAGLPEGFKTERASGWEGGSLDENGILTFNGNNVTYKYNCGFEDLELTFTLAKGYTVHFEPNYTGTGAGEMPDQQLSCEPNTLNGASEHIDEHLNPNSFSRTGYTFNGWSTSASASAQRRAGIPKFYILEADGGSETAYPDEAKITAPIDGAGFSGNVTLYAQWKANNYTVKFNSNGGADGAASQSFTYDEEQPLTANTFERTGCAFTGWNTKADGSGTAYADRQNVSNLTAEAGGVVTLYAQWKVSDYEVHFDAHGGAGSMTNQPFISDTAQNLKTNAFTKTGYHFIGWNTAANGTGTPYADEASVINLTSEAGGVVTLYAQWEINTYTVYWKNWNGELLETDTDVPYRTVPVYDGAAPVMEATARYTYAFAGWSPEPAPIEGDTVYTAKYVGIVNKYTVTFKDWNGTVLKTEEVEYGCGASAPENPTREGYTFIGWDVDFSSITGDLIVTARYEVNSIPGDYDCDGDVDVDDALLTLRAALELVTPMEQNTANADIDKDGRLTVLDVLEILRMALGLV